MQCAVLCCDMCVVDVMVCTMLCMGIGSRVVWCWLCASQCICVCRRVVDMSYVVTRCVLCTLCDILRTMWYMVYVLCYASSVIFKARRV